MARKAVHVKQGDLRDGERAVLALVKKVVSGAVDNRTWLNAGVCVDE